MSNGSRVFLVRTGMDSLSRYRLYQLYAAAHSWQPVSILYRYIKPRGLHCGYSPVASAATSAVNKVNQFHIQGGHYLVEDNTIRIYFKLMALSIIPSVVSTGAVQDDKIRIIAIFLDQAVCFLFC